MNLGASLNFRNQTSLYLWFCSAVINKLNSLVTELSTQCTVKGLVSKWPAYYFACYWLVTVMVIWLSQHYSVQWQSLLFDVKGLITPSTIALHCVVCLIIYEMFPYLFESNMQNEGLHPIDGMQYIRQDMCYTTNPMKVCIPCPFRHLVAFVCAKISSCANFFPVRKTCMCYNV